MATDLVQRRDLRLSSFLTLGYFADAEAVCELDLSRAAPGRLADAGDPELFEDCLGRLRQAVAGGLAPGREHLLPISGGLDSRALLGLLLESVEASQIHTCTFGTPGSWDYELGNELARRLGTRHRVWPLTEHRYDHSELIETSRLVRHRTVLFHHPPLREMREHFGSHRVWSGFLGDKLVKASGGDGPEHEASRRFLCTQRYVRSLRLTPDSEESLVASLALPAERRTHLGPDEDLNFEFRQRRFIAPHVLPLGFEYQTPFTDPEVIGFFLSLPREERLKARFYRRFLRASFPSLFEVGVKNLEGLPLGSSELRALARKVGRKAVARLPSRLRRRLRPDPMLNYLDFARAFRERDDLRGIVEESLLSLKRRELLGPLDPLAIWQRHLRGEADHADALIALTSLEIHLEAGLSLDAGVAACS